MPARGNARARCSPASPAFALLLNPLPHSHNSRARSSAALISDVRAGLIKRRRRIAGVVAFGYRADPVTKWLELPAGDFRLPWREWVRPLTARVRLKYGPWPVLRSEAPWIIGTTEV